MKNTFPYSLMLFFMLFELVALYFYITKRIETYHFLLFTGVAVTGVIAQKLSIDKRKKA